MAAAYWAQDKKRAIQCREKMTKKKDERRRVLITEPAALDSADELQHCNGHHAKKSLIRLLHEAIYG